MTVYILDVRYCVFGAVEGEVVNCMVGALLLKKHFFVHGLGVLQLLP